MTDAERRYKAIIELNRPILAAFRGWLNETGLRRRTIDSHVRNIELFGEYLSTHDPPKRLNKATGNDITMFFASWFPENALWVSIAGTKSHIASLGKFFTWMGPTSKAPSHVVDEALRTLKEERDEFLEAALNRGDEV